MFFVFPPNFIHFILFLCIYALFIFVNQSDRNAIVIGPAWSYYIEGITEKFSVEKMLKQKLSFSPFQQLFFSRLILK